MTRAEKIDYRCFCAQDPADFLDFIDVELARALRGLDRACMIAKNLLENKESIPEQDRKRALKCIKRALAIRSALEAAGIKLPELRRIEDRDEEFILMDPKTWTVGEIAKAVRVNRTTVARWLQVMGGPIGAKYAEARQRGKRVVFSLEDVEKILGVGGRCRDE